MRRSPKTYRTFLTNTTFNKYINIEIFLSFVRRYSNKKWISQHLFPKECKYSFVIIWQFLQWYVCLCVLHEKCQILSHLVDPSGTVICENNSHMLDDLEENVSVSMLWLQRELWRGPDLRGACRVGGSHLQCFCSGKSHLLRIEFSFQVEGFTISVLFKYEQVHYTWEV